MRGEGVYWLLLTTYIKIIQPKKGELIIVPPTPIIYLSFRYVFVFCMCINSLLLLGELFLPICISVANEFHEL